jgi:hypothetical protein
VTELATVAEAEELQVHDGYVYFAGPYAVFRVPLEGGEPVHIANRFTYDSPSFSVSDGYVYLFGPDALSVRRVPVSGGAPRRSSRAWAWMRSWWMTTNAIYLGLVVATAYGLMWHAVDDLTLFSSVRSAKGALVLYLTPLS